MNPPKNHQHVCHHGWVEDPAVFAGLDTRYKPVGLLNEGGMAQLFLAQDCGESCGESWVVLKVLRPHLRHEPQARAMFRDEIRLLRCLSHPNIVRFVDACEDSDLLYLVLEYVDGCDLKTFLTFCFDTEPEPFPWILASQIALQILEGLAYLHNATTEQNRPLHLVYRDLSPSNVLLSMEGQVKLTDFGSSWYQQMFRDTIGQEWRGKFAYLAPELLAGQPADQRSDIFSWGVTVWELFAGRPLFVASNPEAVLQQVRTQPIPFLQEMRPDMPTELCDMVARTLERDPHQRINNTLALLEHWLFFLQTPHCQQAHTRLTYGLAEKISRCMRVIR